MRTVSTAAEDILNSVRYDVHVRCEVENSTGGFVNLGDLNGNWFESAKWDWDLDNPAPQLTVEVRRDSGLSTGESLSPLDEDSTLNRDASTAYAAAIHPGREVKLYTAATTAGASVPSSSDFDWVFHGEIDDVEWPASPLRFVSRGIIMSALQDRWVEELTIYPSTNGSNIVTVMEDILSGWTDLSTDVLWPSSSVGFTMNDWEQRKERVLDALTTISQLVGFDIRERFDEGSTEWRLRFEEPNRTATSSEKDWTFSAKHYFDVHQMAISRDDVRNVVSVLYGPTSSRDSIEVTSTDSIAKFGRRWMEFEEASNSPIDSSSEAETLANAALNDLKDPDATHEIEVPYFWPAELQDYYEFTANDIHYSENQFFGVYGISHELSLDRHRTRIRVRGKPAGQYLRWHTYAGGGGGVEDVRANIVDHRIIPVASTASQQQHFERHIITELATGVQSLKFDYSFLRPSSSGGPAQTIEPEYWIDVTPGEASTHALLSVSSSQEQVFIVNRAASSHGTIKDSNFFLYVTPYSLPGGSSGGGLAGPRVSVEVDILGADGSGVRAYTSSGGELPGEGIRPGSTNVVFEYSTDGTLTLTVN